MGRKQLRSRGQRAGGSTGPGPGAGGGARRAGKPCALSRWPGAGRGGGGGADRPGPGRGGAAGVLGPKGKMSALLEQKEQQERLREAAALGDIREVQKLVESGVDVNSQNEVNGW